MRKVRLILITILILALALAGLSYAARRGASASSNRVVEVTAVENVNEYSGYASYENMEGVIISKDTQTVQRNTGYSLKKVYVSEGDKVSKGDKLVEYDMEKVELEAEKAGLDKWGLELELESMEKELELLKRGIVPVEDSVYRYTGGSSSSGSSSEDDEDSDDSDSSVDYTDYDEYEEADDEEAEYDDEEYVDATMSADIVEDTQTLQTQEDGIVNDEESFNIVEDISEDDGIISDDDAGITQDDGTITELVPMENDPDIAMISSVNAFLKTVNEITTAANESLGVLGEAEYAEEIASALDTFRTEFGEGIQSDQRTVLGEVITVTDYAVSDSVTSIVGETTAHVLQTAYDRLCAYQFVSVMEQLNPDRKSSSSEDSSSASEKKALLREAADLLASLPTSVYNPYEEKFTTAYDALNNMWTGDGSESRVDYLKALGELYNGSSVVEQHEQETDTVSTEGISPSDIGDPTEFDEDDEGEEVDFKELIKEMEEAIFEQKLLIREAELEVKEFNEKLEGRIVYAILDGVVLSMGSTGHGSDNGPLMIIAGKKGLYVRGTIKENSLDTVKVGDIVYGSTYGSTSFTAEIVEVSEYPSEDTGYYYYGDDNSNESNYPFLAFIENTEGLEVDDGVELSLDGEVSEYGYESEDGLALNSALVRTEESGRSYCLVEGSDGKLEKRYLEVGANEWGTVQIKSGLSREDYIAFPYGKGVVEGARTTRVDTLKAMDYGSDLYF